MFSLKIYRLCAKIPQKSPGIRSKLQQCAIIKISTRVKLTLKTEVHTFILGLIIGVITLKYVIS